MLILRGCRHNNDQHAWATRSTTPTFI